MNTDDELAMVAGATVRDTMPYLVYQATVHTSAAPVEVLVFDCPIPDDDGAHRRGELFIAVRRTGPDIAVYPAFTTPDGVRAPGRPVADPLGISTTSAEDAFTRAVDNLATA